MWSVLWPQVCQKSAIVLAPCLQSKYFEEIVVGAHYNYLTAANYAQSKIR